MLLGCALRGFGNDARSNNVTIRRKVPQPSGCSRIARPGPAPHCQDRTGGKRKDLTPSLFFLASTELSFALARNAFPAFINRIVLSY
jgi:hypothetical protein